MMFSHMSTLMASWLSPTSLFLFLNIMIGTIFLISRLSPHKTPSVDDYNSSPLSLHRAPSFLGRVMSFNFSTYRFPLSNPEFEHHLQPADSSAAHRLERAPSILERVKSFNYFYKNSPQSSETDYIQPAQQSLSRAPSLLERVKSFDFTSFYKSDSNSNQTEPTVTDSTRSDMGIGPNHGEVKRLQSEPKVRQRELPEKMKISTSKNSRRKVEEEVEIRRSATTGIEETTTFEEDGNGVDAKADDFIKKFKQQLKLQRLDSLLRCKDVLKGK